MYKVIKFFTDLQDNNYPYNEGDTFPRVGVEVTEGRLTELAGSDNLQGVPLIQPVEEVKEAPKKATAKRTKKTADN